MATDLLETLRRPLDELPDPLPIPLIERAAGAPPRRVVLRPPGSKSLTNRALLLAGLADGRSEVRHPLLEADDAERMLTALDVLGATVERHAEGVAVTGAGGRWRVGPEGAEVFLNNAGTATRFLAASSLVSGGPLTIDGNARMRQRPIGELVELLERLGVSASYLGETGCPPVRLTPPPGGPAADEIDVGRTRSSQFVSALLLVAPFTPRGLTVRLTGEITSSSYVWMTVRLLERVGATVQTTDDLRIVRVLPGLGGFSLDVEPDASGATYLWAAGALLPGDTVGVTGLEGSSAQGDAGFPELLRRMGASIRTDAQGVSWVTGPRGLAPVMADMTDMPDATMTLAVCCAFAPGMSVLHGVATLRDKECDRIAALRSELGKLGVVVRENVQGDPGTMTVEPPQGGVDCSPDAPAVEFDTFDDHRMAMSLSLVGLRRPNVLIRDPGCVRKTYPRYFADLAAVLAG